MKKLCLLLTLLSFSVLSNNINISKESSNEFDINGLNESLKDKRIGVQYIPISKTKENSSKGYSLLDKDSVTLHPYNKRIRLFNEMINWNPSLSKEETEKTNKPSHSIIIKYYANCDKMQLARAKTQWFDKYFGEGNLLDSNEVPNRWVTIKKGDEQRQLLVVACSLPLVDQNK